MDGAAEFVFVRESERGSFDKRINRSVRDTLECLKTISPERFETKCCI